MKKLIYVLLLGLMTFSALPLTAQSNYKIARKIQVGGEGSWDYITVDGKASRIYASHATTAVVVDIKTGKVLGSNLIPKESMVSHWLRKSTEAIPVMAVTHR
jgi:D-alanyl-D-alanine carboxypeptidase